MINASDAFKQKLQDGERVWQEVEIAFPDGTVKTVKNEIMGENCTFSDCAESSSFPIGCVVCKSMTLELDNTSDQWKNYNFYMAKVHAYLKMQTSVASPAATDELLDENYDPILDQSGGAILVTKAAAEDRVETIDKGTYTVTIPEQYGEIIKLAALDDMYKSDTAYKTKLKLPQTLSVLVRDACDTLDIPMGFTVMSHGAMSISKIPENMTFRQFFGYVAMIECANARLNQKGQLEFVKWSLDKEPTIELVDYISAPTISSDDIVITGIEVVKGDKSELYGKTGYVLKMENDLVSDEDLATVAAQIGDSIIGTRFRNLQGELAFNPLLEFGDIAYSYDRKKNKYVTPLTDVSYAVNGKTTVKTQAEDPIKGMSQFVSEVTKAIVAARRLVQQEKTAREKALEEFGKRIDSATGVYTTEEIQEDGSRIFYLHDKPTLAESKVIWKMTSEAWGVSTDGGQTWNGGMTVDGDTIVRILTAVGLNADWINTGAITVKDKSGNIIFQVDMDTKKVIISGDSVVIGGKTATKALSDNLQESKDYSDGKLADYADTVTGSLAGLQAQVDGQIESFFYDYEPSLQNKPASEWTSTEERKKHEGDLFYWKSTGYAYRFMQDGATWKWQMIQDNDISKALAQAEKAQDTADGKRRTFVIQPSPPYDIGDLWSQDGGDILTCVVARAKGSVYASSDWKKLNKYTDDTTANKALEAAALAKNMTLQLSNEMQTITADANGNIAVFPQVSTKATVMYGSSDITDDCSYTITKSDSITGSWSDATHIYNVTGLSADNGWIDIRATYLSNLSVTKRFTISKQKKGEDGKDGEPGRTYMVEPSCNVLKRGSDKTISPNFITFKAYYRDGKSATRVPYKGRFVVEETADGNTWNTIYTSSIDEDTVTHYLYSILTNGSGQTVASSNGSTVGIPRDVTNVRCKLYASGGTTTLMDMQSVAVVIDVDNLTQSQIVEILSNDGAWKGLYYKNGQLYISFNAALGGELTLGGEKNGNGYLKIKDANNAAKGLIDRSGYAVFTSYEENSKYMKYTGVQFSSDGIFPVDIKKFFDDEVDIEIENSENWGISWNDNSLNVYATEVSADTGTFENLTVTNPASFAKSPKIEDMEYTTSSNTICWDGRTGYKQLMLKSSSSKRYKDIGNDISEQEIEEWYNIEPTWAKYKKGYLVKGDENEGRYIPMFIAENVEAFFPEAARHQNGLVEDWNERIMIPAMFAMLKAQKKKIDQQEKLINKLCEKLNIE